MPDSLCKRLSNILKDAAPDRIFLLVDANTSRLSPPYLNLLKTFAPTVLITIPAGEENKNIATLLSITDTMSSIGGTRHSLIVNLGGGMVSDIGGFAAAIFKRGIPYINIATTILAAVDAAIGGKTGVDISVSKNTILKNEIGAFHIPLATFIDSLSFNSLPHIEKLSGYGEMLKTAILSSKRLYLQLLRGDEVINHPEILETCVEECAEFKRKITSLDPKENGLRRILNLGHTAGHAFESRLICKGTHYPHGICIAHGILFAMILSHICLDFPSREISIYAGFLKSFFPSLILGCKDMPEIITLMSHDKKNRAGACPSFVLLRDIAAPVETFVPTGNQILEALDIYRDQF